MLRFIYVIIMRIPSIIWFVPKMAHYAKHPEKYSEEDCYRLAQVVIDKVRRTARVTTEYEGKENLPDGSGYMMFANHQGKYDALGIFAGHERTCSVLMDKKRSNMFIAKQFIDMLGGQRIDRRSPKQQITVINNMAREVAEGRNYLIFPEGGYGKKRDNSLAEFKYGCFTSAIKAQCPVIPVVLLDSWKPFGMNSLKKIHTKVIYLPPIPYEEYEGMKAKELCALVKERIAREIERQESERLAEAS
ncbi:MAG: 1-acyl-sn-glycerol-3-phosphate acyltransferase [Ruminococcaceae bacterium]|nr:1-acyl-sn-glycerol-3-phosphate acyltransferase [Oscillospiraceae bacterium]